MGLDYALVHLLFTIPPAIILSVILSPLVTRLDVYKICFLITVAVLYTTPWDAYLIHNNIWTYPPNAILGPTMFRIPLEELFFFVIQTYITSLLYILLNKPTLFPVYLRNGLIQDDPNAKRSNFRKIMGQIFFASMSSVPFYGSVGSNREGTYMRMICVWAGPVLLVLWSLAHQLLLGLPQSKTRLAIILPTLYLWVVDTIALHRGTWNISTGTKMGREIWPGLDIEEAVFFLVTNALVVFGLCAFDNAIAIIDAFPDIYPTVPTIPSPKFLVEALLISPLEYDQPRLRGLRNALVTLSKKSRSFYLASGVFSRRLRIDLVILYAFCRVADDLVDQSENAKEAEQWIGHLSHFLKTAYSTKASEKQREEALAPFSEETRSILALLPVDILPAKPLHSLLDGFKSDVKFMKDERRQKSASGTPIRTEADLEQYASRVASTVAELCLELAYCHNPDSDETDDSAKKACIEAGKQMGIALQYINIARDVATDAEVGRTYIPQEWLQTPPPATPRAFADEVTALRERILDKAFALYEANRGEIERLPKYCRSGIRVAVESYVEIGRVMKEKLAKGESLDGAGSGKASVPRLRRLWIVWRTMLGPR